MRQLSVATLSVDDRRTDSPSSLGGGGAGPAAGLGGTPSASGTPSLSPVSFATPTPAETRAFEEERTKLYQQIDEKVEQRYLTNSLPFELCVYMYMYTHKLAHYHGFVPAQ